MLSPALKTPSTHRHPPPYLPSYLKPSLASWEMTRSGQSSSSSSTNLLFSQISQQYNPQDILSHQNLWNLRPLAGQSPSCLPTPKDSPPPCMASPMRMHSRDATKANENSSGNAFFLNYNSTDPLSPALGGVAAQWHPVVYDGFLFDHWPHPQPPLWRPPNTGVLPRCSHSLPCLSCSYHTPNQACDACHKSKHHCDRTDQSLLHTFTISSLLIILSSILQQLVRPGDLPLFVAPITVSTMPPKHAPILMPLDTQCLLLTLVPPHSLTGLGKRKTDNFRKMQEVLNPTRQTRKRSETWSQQISICHCSPNVPPLHISHLVIHHPSCTWGHLLTLGVEAWGPFPIQYPWVLWLRFCLLMLSTQQEHPVHGSSLQLSKLSYYRTYLQHVQETIKCSAFSSIHLRPSPCTPDPPPCMTQPHKWGCNHDWPSHCLYEATIHLSVDVAFMMLRAGRRPIVKIIQPSDEARMHALMALQWRLGSGVEYGKTGWAGRNACMDARGELMLGISQYGVSVGRGWERRCFRIQALWCSCFLL